MEYYLHDDPRMEGAWAPWFSHEYLVYFAVQALPPILDLPAVRVQPKPDLKGIDWPQGPKHVDLYKESYVLGETLDLFDASEYGTRNGEYTDEPPTGRTIEPWKILVLYSTEPDLHPDCDLNLHRLQTITGGSHGWRHMQFNDLGVTIGAVSESFRKHREMAVQSFRLGNDYWGWRYLSRATHYLADMGHPFHVRAAPRWYLIRNLLNFRELFKTVSALHTGYEVYSERRFREGLPAFKKALMEGATQGAMPGQGVDADLHAYMGRAKGRHAPIFHFMRRQFGQDLIDVYGSVKHDGADDVSAQTKGCAREAARVLFQERHLESLGFLDDATEAILRDVGRMLGMLLAGFCR